MKNIIKLFVLFTMFASVLAVGQTEKYENESGYAEFGDLTGFDSGDRVVEVIIDQKYLRMVSKFTGDEEPELSNLIGGLKLIKVNTYGVTEDNEQGLKSKMEKISKNLESSNWDMLVKVRDTNEFVNVFINSPDGEVINGLVVLAIDSSGEAVFVNIVGTIDLEQIGKLTKRFDIPGLDEIDRKKRNNEEG